MDPVCNHGANPECNTVPSRAQSCSRPHWYGDEGCCSCSLAHQPVSSYCTCNREARIKSFLVGEQDPAECWVPPSGRVAAPLLLLVPLLPLMIVSESPTSAGVLASLKDVAAARFSVSLFFPMCGLSMTAYHPPSPRVQTMSESYSRVDRQQVVFRSWPLFS